MIREKIAELIIVDCGYGTDYPCPHIPEGNPFGTFEVCPHEDEDICMWQREQAAEIHQKYIEDGWVKLADNQELPCMLKFGVEKMASTYKKELTTPKDGEVWKKVKE